MSTAHAQQSGKVYRIALVDPAIPTAEFSDATSDFPAARAFYNELHRLGYIEGENILIERYSGEGRAAHYPDLVRDVVRRNPDLIIAYANDLVLDFKAATTTIPIVGVFAFPVEAVVLMGRSAHGSLLGRPSVADQAAVARSLERFGIAGLAARPYTMISGGERQLVLLARALAQEPQFIVLDEPTSSLDFGNQGKVLREIRSLAAAGLGVLFTTHDPNHALRAADRAYLIRDGARIAEGIASNVLTRAALEQLYGAPVEQLDDPATGGSAFLPDWVK